MIPVLMWFLMIFFVIIGIGFAIGAILFLMGCISQIRRDYEMTLTCGLASFVCAILCAGATFAALAMWRNLH